MKTIEVTLKALISVPEHVDESLQTGSPQVFDVFEIELLHRLQAQKLKIVDITDKTTL